MSYLKTIQKNRMKNGANLFVKHEGGIDILIVSPPKGDPEPLYKMFRKEQLSSDAAAFCTSHRP